MIRKGVLSFTVASLAILSSAAGAAKPKYKSYKAPRMKYVGDVTWGTCCERKDGGGLAFGGQDRKADDGRPHTRVKRNGKWVSIAGELQKKNSLQKFCARFYALRARVKQLRALARHVYMEGKGEQPAAELAAGVKKAVENLAALNGELKAAAGGAKKYEAGQVAVAMKSAKSAGSCLNAAGDGFGRGIEPGAISALRLAQVALCRAAEALDAEPPARVASAIVLEPKSGLYVLFGGDHYDYLTNDTWVFDPEALKWEQRHPASAPLPRGDHKLVAAGDGKVKLSGGYTYRFSLNYMAAQYGALEDGEWVYDVSANTWTGTGNPDQSGSCVYRRGPFLPGYFLGGEKPDAGKQAAALKSLPANTWVELKQSHRPQLNRDWGTAIFDFDRDLILFWSGGHSAHGGTDVLHYHPATNRWELPCEVELPLGQLYVGGEGYPAGYNFNRRPWMNGHTRKTYGYDRRLKKMVFVAPPSKDPHFYLYDSKKADWCGRGPWPASMNYYLAYHTLFICCSPVGTYVWNAKGQLLSLDAKKLTWTEVKLSGEKLPGTAVDACAITYDPKRDRLICMKGWYGRPHDGQVYEIDRKTWKVKALNPTGRALVKRGFSLRESAYHPESDLILISVTEKDSLARTVAYDCAQNSWITLKISGATPRKSSNPKYRLKYAKPYGPVGNNSIALRYDPKRKLFWAVNTRCRVWVLLLDAKSAR